MNFREVKFREVKNLMHKDTQLERREVVPRIGLHKFKCSVLPVARALSLAAAEQNWRKGCSRPKQLGSPSPREPPPRS